MRHPDAGTRIVRPRRRRTDRRHQRVREYFNLAAVAGSGNDTVTSSKEIDESCGQVYAGRVVTVWLEACERRRCRTSGGKFAAKDPDSIFRTGAGTHDDVVRRSSVNLRRSDAHAPSLRRVERLEP